MIINKKNFFKTIAIIFAMVTFFCISLIPSNQNNKIIYNELKEEKFFSHNKKRELTDPNSKKEKYRVEVTNVTINRWQIKNKNFKVIDFFKELESADIDTQGKYKHIIKGYFEYISFAPSQSNFYNSEFNKKIYYNNYRFYVYVLNVFDGSEVLKDIFKDLKILFLKEFKKEYTNLTVYSNGDDWLFPEKILSESTYIYNGLNEPIEATNLKNDELSKIFKITKLDTINGIWEHYQIDSFLKTDLIILGYYYAQWDFFNIKKYNNVNFQNLETDFVFSDKDKIPINYLFVNNDELKALIQNHDFANYPNTDQICYTFSKGGKPNNLNDFSYGFFYKEYVFTIKMKTISFNATKQNNIKLDFTRSCNIIRLLPLLSKYNFEYHNKNSDFSIQFIVNAYKVISINKDDLNILPLIQNYVNNNIDKLKQQEIIYKFPSFKLNSLSQKWEIDYNNFFYADQIDWNGKILRHKYTYNEVVSLFRNEEKIRVFGQGTKWDGKQTAAEVNYNGTKYLVKIPYNYFALLNPSDIESSEYVQNPFSVYMNEEGILTPFWFEYEFDILFNKRVKKYVKTLDLFDKREREINILEDKFDRDFISSLHTEIPLDIFKSINLYSLIQTKYNSVKPNIKITFKKKNTNSYMTIELEDFLHSNIEFDYNEPQSITIDFVTDELYNSLLPKSLMQKKYYFSFIDYAPINSIKIIKEPKLHFEKINDKLIDAGESVVIYKIAENYKPKLIIPFFASGRQFSLKVLKKQNDDFILLDKNKYKVNVNENTVEIPEQGIYKVVIINDFYKQISTTEIIFINEKIEYKEDKTKLECKFSFITNHPNKIIKINFYKLLPDSSWKLLQRDEIKTFETLGEEYDYKININGTYKIFVEDLSDTGLTKIIVINADKPVANFYKLIKNDNKTTEIIIENLNNTHFGNYAFKLKYVEPNQFYASYLLNLKTNEKIVYNDNDTIDVQGQWELVLYTLQDKDNISLQTRYKFEISNKKPNLKPQNITAFGLVDLPIFRDDVYRCYLPFAIANLKEENILEQNKQNYQVSYYFTELGQTSQTIYEINDVSSFTNSFQTNGTYTIYIKNKFGNTQKIQVIKTINTTNFKVMKSSYDHKTNITILVPISKQTLNEKVLIGTESVEKEFILLGKDYVIQPFGQFSTIKYKKIDLDKDINSFNYFDYDYTYSNGFYVMKITSEFGTSEEYFILYKTGFKLPNLKFKDNDKEIVKEFVYNETSDDNFIMLGTKEKPFLTNKDIQLNWNAIHLYKDMIINDMTNPENTTEIAKINNCSILSDYNFNLDKEEDKTYEIIINDRLGYSFRIYIRNDKKKPKFELNNVNALNISTGNVYVKKIDDDYITFYLYTKKDKDFTNKTVFWESEFLSREGHYLVQAIDKAGNTNEMEFIIDNKAPSIIIKADEKEITESIAYINTSFIIAELGDDTKCYINNKEAHKEDSFDSEGTYEIFLKRDNGLRVKLVIFINKEVPKITFTEADTDKNITITGDKNNPFKTNKGLKLSWKNTENLYYSVLVNDEYQNNGVLLSVGKLYKIVVTDNYGNQNTYYIYSSDLIPKIELLNADNKEKVEKDKVNFDLLVVFDEECKLLIKTNENDFELIAIENLKEYNNKFQYTISKDGNYKIIVVNSFGNSSEKNISIKRTFDEEEIDVSNYKKYTKKSVSLLFDNKKFYAYYKNGNYTPGYKISVVGVHKITIYDLWGNNKTYEFEINRLNKPINIFDLETNDLIEKNHYNKKCYFLIEKDSKLFIKTNDDYVLFNLDTLELQNNKYKYIIEKEGNFDFLIIDKFDNETTATISIRNNFKQEEFIITNKNTKTNAPVSFVYDKNLYQVKVNEINYYGDKPIDSNGKYNVKVTDSYGNTYSYDFEIRTAIKDVFVEFYYDNKYLEKTNIYETIGQSRIGVTFKIIADDENIKIKHNKNDYVPGTTITELAVHNFTIADEFGNKKELIIDNQNKKNSNSDGSKLGNMFAIILPLVALLFIIIFSVIKGSKSPFKAIKKPKGNLNSKTIKNALENDLEPKSDDLSNKETITDNKNNESSKN